MPADIILNNEDTEIVENVRLTRSKGRDHTILLDASNGNIVLGGDGRDGDLLLRDTSDNEIFSLDAAGGNMSLGGHGRDGDILIKDNDGKTRIHFDSQHGAPNTDETRVYISGRDGNIFLGGDNADGDVILKDNDGNDIIQLDAGSGNVHIGGNGKDGDIVLKDNTNNARIHFDAQHTTPTSEEVRVYLSGQDGRITLGGTGRDGDLHIRDVESQVRIQLDGEPQKPPIAQTRVYIAGTDAMLKLGGDGKGGEIKLLDDKGETIISAEATGEISCKYLRTEQITLSGIGDLADKISELEGGSPSDERLKENIELIKDPMAVIKRLNGVRFNWKKDASDKSRGSQIGLVAQQVNEFLPEAVEKDARGYYRINYDSIVAMLLETIKEQQVQLNQLGNSVSLLQDRIGRIEVKG